MALFTDRIEPKDFGKMPEEYRELLTRLLTIQADCEVDAFKVDMPEWGDFAAFGFLIDKVGQYQLDEMVGSSFLPTDDVLPTILREELGHVAYGEQQLEKMMATPEGKIAAQRAIDKWYVVGLDMFGRSESARDG